MKAWHQFVALAVVGSSFACSAASQDLGDNGGRLGAAGPTSTGGGGGDAPGLDGGSGPAGGGTGTLVLFGGDDGSSKLNETWTFDGASWSPLSVKGSPPARSYASMSTLGAQLVLFGGDQTNADLPYFGDTWTFDGKTWTQQKTPDMTPRGMGTAGTANDKVVLFGGREQKPFDGIDKNVGDTWTFGGAGWSQVTGSAPAARYFGSAASVSGKVVLFGGAGDSGVLDDTWTFDGSAWRQVQVTSPPPARYAASMAALGDEVVLFGGRVGGPSGSFNPTSFDDTWMFDGTSWRQIPLLIHPPARAGASMGSRGNQVVLFGGSKDLGSSAPMSDTWTFDGTSWTLVTGVSPPSGRNGASFAPMP
jgi:N-acetylneuraminic acid mutarotase